MYPNMDIWTDINQLEHNNKDTLYPYIIITSIGTDTKNLLSLGDPTFVWVNISWTIKSSNVFILV